MKETEKFDQIDFEQSPHYEELEGQVERAQAQLQELRRQQELIENQKRELEELSRKQRLFSEKRDQLTRDLNKTVHFLHSESFTLHQRSQDYLEAKEKLARHLALIDEMDPDSWPRNEVSHQLNHALRQLEEASHDYQEAMVRLELEGNTAAKSKGSKARSAASGESSEFQLWLMRGFAFTLPLLVLSLIIAILIIVRS